VIGKAWPTKEAGQRPASIRYFVNVPT
jgi:hypothetical protein